MSLEIRILYEPACRLYVCQHHHTGDFPFHPFSKQERFLINWDKTLIFFLLYFNKHGTMSVFHASRKQMPLTNIRLTHHIYAYLCMYVPVISHVSAYSVLLQTVSILLVSLEKNHRKSWCAATPFSCFFGIYLAFCDIGQRNNVDLTFLYLHF